MSRRSYRFPAWRPILGALTIATSVLQPGFASGVLADPASPITVSNVATPSPVPSGAQLTYTISVQNVGGAKITNVVLTDQVNGVGTIQNPPGLPQLIITSTKGSCTQGGPNGNLVNCSIGAMNGGESFVVTIRGQVTAGSGTTLNNTASVSGTKTAQNFTTTGSVSTLVSGGTGGALPDLTINKTGPTTVGPNAPMTYTLTVNNIGTANATGVMVVDTLPSGVTLSGTIIPAVVGSSLFTCSSTGTPVTVTCVGGAVNQGQNATITINAVSPASGTLTNTAVVDPNNTIVESNELNNTSALVNTTVGGPPPAPLLDIQKTDGKPAPSGTWWTGAGPDPVNPGQKLTYKILVTNNATGSNSRADDVVTTDGTQGLDASSIVASQVVSNGTLGTTGGCVVAAPQVRCSLKTLNSGGTQLITITGTVLQSAGSSIFNTATVTGNIKNTGVTNTASEVTTVRPAVDLTITKADNGPVCARTFPGPVPPLPIPPGTAPCLGGLIYTFVVGNSGVGAPATGVVVRDPLPPGVIFDSCNAPAFTACGVDASNVFTATGGTLAGPSTTTITVVTVAPPTVGLLPNTVTVDPNNAIFESDETNNTFTINTTVKTGIDLVLDKRDIPPGFDPIATNGTQTYTIRVDDIGPQDATGVVVRDTLPAATRFLSVTGDDGFTCSHDGSPTGGIVTCVGGHLLGTESEFYPPPGAGEEHATIIIKLFAQPFVGTMHNEVRVDPDNLIPEINELNNIATQDTQVVTGNDDKGAFNQLTIAKTQTSPAGAVATNGTLVYDLDVTNVGTDPVSNVVVKDFLPAGSRFISAQDTGSGSAAFFCTHDGSATGGTITCVGGDFSGTVTTIPGVLAERHITVTVFAPNTPGTYTNHATVDPDNIIPEGNEFDNDASANTTVAVGGANAFNELSITKTQTDPALNIVSTSSVVTYQIVVTNSGSDPAFNVRVTDTLPAGFTFISALDTVIGPDPQKFVCVPAAGNTIECTGATLSGTPNVVTGEPISRTIEVKATSSAVPGNYVNTAIVDPANVIPEGNETNNTAQAPTKVVVGGGFIDLSLAKCDQPPAPCTIDSDPVVPSGNITYVITATNNGTNPAFNVKVTDVLPAGTTFVSAADQVPGAGAFTCTFSSGVINCTGATIDGSLHLIPSLPTSRTIEVVLGAPAANGPVTNQATIDPDNTIAESDETNNSATQTTTVASKINLTLDKTGPDTAHQNDTADYVITVKNEAVYGGGQTAFGVHVHDALPVGLIPLSVKADPSNMICQITENPVNVVDCVGDMSAPGASPDSSTVTITVHVFVTADGGALDNEACVDPTDAAHPNGLIIESNEGDNCKTKTTVVLKLSPDLLVNKSADVSTATPGQTITYTVTVSNVGDASAAGPITVTDTLDPSKVDFVSASGTNGFDPCTFSSPDITCPGGGLAPGDSTTITVKAKVKTGVTSSIVNKASVPDNTAFDGAAAECASGNCANEGDANTTSTNANNSDSVTTSVGGTGIDLVMLSFTDNSDPTAPGGVETYTATVTNTGTADATGVKIRVVLPATGLNQVSSAASNGFLCTFLFPNIECTGDLASGATTVVTVITQVTASAPPDTSVTVTATVDPDNTIAEDNETNNTKDQTTTVHASCATGCIDLVMSPIVASPDTAHVGDIVTYVIGVGNAGDTTSGTFDISLKLANTADFDFEPGGFDASQPSDDYSATPGATTGFDCTLPLLSDTVKCTGDLNGGQGVLIILKVHVTAATNPSLTLTATADSGNSVTEASELNNVATKSVTLAP